MKIRYSLFLLAALMGAYPTSEATAAIVDPSIELTIEQKTMIVENAREELSKYKIFLNKDSIKEILKHNQFPLYEEPYDGFIPLHEWEQMLFSYALTFTWIQELGFAPGHLIFIPDSIGNLTNLTHLGLPNSNFTSLPNSIGNLTNLRTLLLLNNKLISLPETIGNLTQLVYLNLSGNELKSLPESIENLTKLRTLDLAGNKLKSLPESIENLIGLGFLNLTGNDLRTLPASIKNIPNLTTLLLRDNPHLLQKSDNPLELGKEELRAHFGYNVQFND
ncbi:MAG: leucine-rich repeat domain-containing protein [Alphaproteobacteria bacterium]|nr:leucine-rich repeat domain-containing protein [Alphaproteobacteria bacterium]